MVEIKDANLASSSLPSFATSDTPHQFAQTQTQQNWLKMKEEGETERILKEKNLKPKTKQALLARPRLSIDCEDCKDKTARAPCLPSISTSLPSPTSASSFQLQSFKATFYDHYKHNDPWQVHDDKDNWWLTTLPTYHLCWSFKLQAPIECVKENSSFFLTQRTCQLVVLFQLWSLIFFTVPELVRERVSQSAATVFALIAHWGLHLITLELHLVRAILFENGLSNYAPPRVLFFLFLITSRSSLYTTDLWPHWPNPRNLHQFV